MENLNFLYNEQMWLVFSFLLFIAATFKIGKAALYKTLDKKISAISDELHTAESIRVQAQELLAQYQRKQKDATIEAENIIKNAHIHAEQIKKIAHQDIENMIDRKEVQLNKRIVMMKQQAKQEIKDHIIDVSIEASKITIAKNLKSDKKIIDGSLKELGKNISKAA